MSVFMCLCACVCLHEEGLQEHYAEGDSEGIKISILKTFTLLEDSISVFQYWVWISTPSGIRKKWFTK